MLGTRKLGSQPGDCPEAFPTPRAPSSGPPPRTASHHLPLPQELHFPAGAGAAPRLPACSRERQRPWLQAEGLQVRALAQPGAALDAGTLGLGAAELRRGWYLGVLGRKGARANRGQAPAVGGWEVNPRAPLPREIRYLDDHLFPRNEPFQVPGPGQR